MRYAVIMAGGSGTRLWPMSTRDQPKQLIPFVGGKSLLELAAERLEGLVEPACRYICTGEAMRSAIGASLPQFGDEQILGEPIGRDTVNAVGFSAAVLHARDPDAVVAVLTADHLIEPVEVFQQRMAVGFDVAEAHADALVTFGIRPTYPATEYGYIQLGDPLAGFEHARRVQAFKEKPAEATARSYLERGHYHWNSGMFVWRAATLLQAIEWFLPESHEGVTKIAEAWDGPQRQAVLDDAYPRLPAISVDYAVMEPASRDERLQVITVEMPVRWIDVGSWPSYGETHPPDDAGNRVAAEKALLMDTRNTLVVGSDPSHLIATIGLEDIVVVHTARATLICHRNAAQNIKNLHAEIRDTLGDAYL